MKSVKFSSSFKKLRRNVSSLLHPFNLFRSQQIEINKLIVSRLEDVYCKIKDLDSLLSGHKSSIEFLYERNVILSKQVRFLNERNVILSKQVRFLKNAMIVISSFLVGVVFYLISIF